MGIEIGTLKWRTGHWWWMRVDVRENRTMNSPAVQRLHYSEMIVSNQSPRPLFPGKQLEDIILSSGMWIAACCPSVLEY
jgi:hypothetical protein